MGCVVTLAIKDLRLLLRDKLGLFFIAVFPVIMGVFFGLVGVSMSSSSTPGSMSLGVIDNDDSEYSRLFIEALAKESGAKVQALAYEQAVNQVRRGKLVGYISLKKGFGETAGIFWADAPPVEIGVDPSKSAQSAMLQGFVMQAMGSLIQKRFTNPGAMRPQLQNTIKEIDSQTDMDPLEKTALLTFLRGADFFYDSFGGFGNVAGPDGEESGMPSMELVKIEVVEVTAPPSKTASLYKKIRSPWDISFPAAMMWGVMACVAGFAITVAKERSAGTFLRLSIAPIARWHILAGKGLACFVTTIAVVAFMMCLGLILGIQLHSPPLLVLATLCLAACFVGVMMLMSVIGKSEAGVSGAAWAIVVVMCMFGGGMMPLAFLPSFMQKISHFSPVKWGILSLEGAIWRGFSFTEMLLPCGIMLGIGALCFALGGTILSRVRD